MKVISPDSGRGLSFKVNGYTVPHILYQCDNYLMTDFLIAINRSVQGQQLQRDENELWKRKRARDICKIGMTYIH